MNFLRLSVAPQMTGEGGTAKRAVTAQKNGRLLASSQIVFIVHTSCSWLGVFSGSNRNTDAETVSRDHVGERVEKQLSVSVAEKNLLAGVAAAGQMVDCSREFHP